MSQRRGVRDEAQEFFAINVSFQHWECYAIRHHRRSDGISNADERTNLSAIAFRGTYVIPVFM